MKKIYSLALMLFLSFATSAQVVISQVYGGGGNSGATYTHDFVELFNRGTTAVDISGYSIQYAATSGTSWAVNVIPASTSIAAGKYYLIKLAAGIGNGVALPTPDLDVTTSPLSLSGSSGKVALVNNSTALVGGTPTAYVDFVGYGTANHFEGTAPVATLTNTTSAQRLNAGCTDNNNNSTDFTTGLPIPRNSSTATNVCSTSPSLAIASPVSGASFAPGSNVSVSISVSNFIVGNTGTGINGHIAYTLTPGGALTMKYDTTPIVFTGLATGTYTLAMSLVASAGTALNPPVATSITFTIEPLNTVANLNALRTDVLTNGVGKYYQISSTPVATYSRPSTAAARYQIYIQDETAGILIDDATNILATTIVAGDAISGLKGRTSNFNGLLQFNPISDATVASSGNVITPQVVTAANILANVETYESELVQINNVTIPAGTFTVSQNYTVNDGTNITLRTLFSESDYITTATPSTAVNMVCLVGESTTGALVTPRNNADFLPLSNTQFEIDGFKTYPNPVTNGVLNITTSSNDLKTIEIFDVAGKKVFNTIISGENVNVSALKTGVYMIKVTENNKVSTQKLMIK
ncbi:MAG: T9SS type A sorting domain-containing protein [Flavobacterium sp.]